MKKKLLLIVQLLILFNTVFAQKAFKVYDKSKKAYGVFNLKGTQIISTEFDEIFYINKTFHCFKKGKEGIISLNGTVIVPIEFDSVIYSNCGPPKIYSAYKQGKWIIFNSDGKKLSKQIYDKVSAPTNNKIGLEKNGHFFELDIESGKSSKISRETFDSFKSYYDECMDISMEGASCSANIIKENGFYGCKEKGEWVIRPTYESLNFTCEFWIARIEGKYGILSKAGEELTGFEYENISNHMNYAILTKNNKMGVFSLADRKLVLLLDYDKITFFE